MFIANLKTNEVIAIPLELTEQFGFLSPTVLALGTKKEPASCGWCEVPADTVVRIGFGLEMGYKPNPEDPNGTTKWQRYTSQEFYPGPLDQLDQILSGPVAKPSAVFTNLVKWLDANLEGWKQNQKGYAKEQGVKPPNWYVKYDEQGPLLKVNMPFNGYKGPLSQFECGLFEENQKGKYHNANLFPTRDVFEQNVDQLNTGKLPLYTFLTTAVSGKENWMLPRWLVGFIRADVYTRKEGCQLHIKQFQLASVTWGVAERAILLGALEKAVSAHDKQIKEHAEKGLLPANYVGTLFWSIVLDPADGSCFFIRDLYAFVKDPRKKELKVFINGPAAVPADILKQGKPEEIKAAAAEVAKKLDPAKAPQVWG